MNCINILNRYLMLPARNLVILTFIFEILILNYMLRNLCSGINEKKQCLNPNKFKRFIFIPNEPILIEVTAERKSLHHLIYPYE